MKHVVFLLIFALVLGTVFVCAGKTQAAPLSMEVESCVADRVEDGAQLIIFTYTVTNTSHYDYISSLNSMDLMVSGSGNGRSSRYERTVRVNEYFTPPLAPGKSRRLVTKFWRRVDPYRGLLPYRRVNVFIDSYTFRRAH